MAVQRSARYVEMLSTALDAGTHVPDRAKAFELLDAIAAEFPELAMAELPSGIVAKCYLGSPYEVHTLDASLSIVTHYKGGVALPGNLEPARALAMHPAYAFIEVYGTELRTVTREGRVITVPRTSEV